jgi:hypothetical protein
MTDTPLTQSEECTECVHYAYLSAAHAKLEKERSALCEMCDAMMKTEDLLRKEGNALRAAILNERERCAKICEQEGENEIAAAIRYPLYRYR